MTVQPSSTSSAPSTVAGWIPPRASSSPLARSSHTYQPKPLRSQSAASRAICSSTCAGASTPPSVAPTRGSPSIAISPSRCPGPIGSARIRAVVRIGGAFTGPGRVPRGRRGPLPGAQLVDAAVRARERVPVVLDLDARDRAVERVVLAAGRVGVDPRDGLAGGAATRTTVAPRRTVAAAGVASTSTRARKPPSRTRRPRSSSSAPLAIHGVVRPAIRTRPTARSSHAPGAPSKPIPCSHSHVSACCAPQL